MYNINIAEKNSKYQRHFLNNPKHSPSFTFTEDKFVSIKSDKYFTFVICLHSPTSTLPDSFFVDTVGEERVKGKSCTLSK